MPSFLPPLYDVISIPTTPFVRDSLIVKRTNLRDSKGNRLPFRGLFAAEPIPAFAFLGLYEGDFYEEREEDEEFDPVRHPPEHSHYAINISGAVVVPESERGTDGVDPRRFPLAMLNEPPEGTVSSVSVVEWLTAADAAPGIPPSKRVFVAAMHACRAIGAGEEIYFHYGDEYDRRHYPKRQKIGTACRPIRRGDVPEHERPRAYLTARGIHAVTDRAVVVLE